MPSPRVASVVVVAVAGLLGAGSATAVAEPVSPAPVTVAAAPPYETWIADVTVVANQATEYLNGRLDGTGKPAIVLDIDNTSLETYYHFDLFRTPALAPILAVAKLAKDKGAAVFFVTGRPGIGEPITRDNLTAVGYRFDGLYQTGLTDVFDLQRYKTAKRTEIEGMGYTITANIGNSASDLAGGHAERTFKLPDYDGTLA